jgi:hypothetical protein
MTVLGLIRLLMKEDMDKRVLINIGNVTLVDVEKVENDTATVYIVPEKMGLPFEKWKNVR